jgi:hypothetical protein
MPNVYTKGRQKVVAKGQKGIKKRINPKPPSFNKILAKITEPIVGASTCASGNHRWKGIIGIFVANVKKKQNHKKNCSFFVKL